MFKSCDPGGYVNSINWKKPVWKEIWSRIGVQDKPGEIIPKVLESQWKGLSQWRWRRRGNEMFICDF